MSATRHTRTALCPCHAHDRVIAHILPVGFFFIGFSVFVFFFPAANASSELTTGKRTAALNAASTLAMRSFFTGDLRCSSTGRTIQHLRLSRQSGRLLRNRRMSTVRAHAPAAIAAAAATLLVRSKAVPDKVCALSTGLVLIKTHTSPRIRVFVV
jgi:hypothetical protein